MNDAQRQAMRKPFEDYMPDREEYADPTEVNVGAYGWCIDYISATFQNGWINYTRVLKAFACHRYLEGGPAALRARVDAMNAERGHLDLGTLEDDVVILAKDGRKGEGPGYWFFHFDPDVSDCSIGRVRTDDREDVVVAAFEAFVRADKEAVFELAPDRFTSGWVHF